MTRFFEKPLRKLVPGVTAVLTLLSLGACDQPEPADVVEIIGAAQPCVGCRVELGPPMELRTESGSPFVVAPTTLSVDGQGRYWLAELNQMVRVFDANGQFIKTIGRKVGDSTEFGPAAAFLALPGDSMLVFDFASAKDTLAFVVDSQFRVARTVRLPDYLLPASADGWPKRMLVSGMVRGAGNQGWTLHEASAEGKALSITKSFGNDKVRMQQNITAARFQRVTPAKDGGIWSADILQYQLSHFAKDGTLLATIERNPDWFPAATNDNIGTPTSPPPPKIISIWQASDGLLWVFGRVAGKNWRDGWPKLPPGAQGVDFRTLALEKLYGSVVEVLDPVTQKVVTTAKLDEYITDVLPNGNVAVYSVDSAHVSHVSILRLTLAR